jgi:hypothetical protein
LQGEECDIILVSLVRSNTERNVGFLREPERINVMLSRAREGLIMVGNAKTFANASNSEAQHHWGHVFGLLLKEGQLVDSFPAVCKCHGTRQELKTPKDFRDRTPDGGCPMPCGQKLPCGHTCTLRCHAYDHAHVRCEELVISFCPSQHLVTRKCSDPEAACPTCVELEQMREEQRRAARKLVSVHTNMSWIVPALPAQTIARHSTSTRPTKWSALSHNAGLFGHHVCTTFHATNSSAADRKASCCRS